MDSHDDNKALAAANALVTLGADTLQELPDFGIFCLSVWEAANLVAAERWFGGETHFSIKDGENMNWRSIAFQERISPDALRISNALIASIDNGELKPVRLSRDLDGHTSPWDTYIRFGKLEKWAASREIVMGDIFHEYASDEANFLSLISYEVCRQRAIQALTVNPPGVSPSLLDIEAASPEELRSALRAALAALNLFTSDSKQTKVKPEHDSIPTPQRKRSLLAVIGGLSIGADLDLAKRGTTAKVSQLTEHFGHPVGEDTVGKIVSEVRDLARDARPPKS